MKEKSLITVILPVRNSAITLADCLYSLLHQTYTNLEIIAIDDFSTDNSMSILRSFKKKDKRLRIYKNVKSYGPAVTLNRLIKKTKGSYIAFMDPSDVSKLNRLAKQYRFLVKNPEFKIGKSNFPMENSEIYQNPLHGISMQFETVLINKLMLPKDIIKFNIGSNPFIYSDIFMKIIPYGKFANLPDFLHHHRNHPDTYISEIRKNILSLIKLLIKGKTLYDYQAPIRTFFSPLIKSA